MWDSITVNSDGTKNVWVVNAFVIFTDSHRQFNFHPRTSHEDPEGE
jgi:hypothetical protein